VQSGWRNRASVSNCISSIARAAFTRAMALLLVSRTSSLHPGVGLPSAQPCSYRASPSPRPPKAVPAFFHPVASNVGPNIAAPHNFPGLRVALLFRHFLSPDGRARRREGAIMMTDSTVNDFRDPALDNLAASLDHLTRCFCDADERLKADEGIGGAPPY